MTQSSIRKSCCAVATCVGGGVVAAASVDTKALRVTSLRQADPDNRPTQAHKHAMAEMEA